MSPGATNPYLLSDDEFDALEALLTSDAVPADCMSLEMLDGYLAGVIASPEAVEPGDWLPGVWSAHEDALTFGPGRETHHIVRLVLAYYNELVTSIGASDGWEPFCYAASEGDDMALGEEWIEGFMQGLELWPEGWPDKVSTHQAREVKVVLEQMVAPWESASASEADDERRLEWLTLARKSIENIFKRWRAQGLVVAQPIDADGLANELTGVHATD